MYQPMVGDVIYNNGMRMVVVDFKTNETPASMSYDREYKLCLLEEIEGERFLELDSLGMWVQVKGLTFPEVEKCEDTAPFEIKTIQCIKIRQKTPKTICIYE
jgi:hypothetical protein